MPSTKTPAPVTSCQQLLDTVWSAPIAEPQISYIPESGIATIILGDETLNLDVLNDEACKRVPTVGPLVEQLLADAAQFD